MSVWRSTDAEVIVPLRDSVTGDVETGWVEVDVATATSWHSFVRLSIATSQAWANDAEVVLSVDEVHGLVVMLEEALRRLEV